MTPQEAATRLNAELAAHPALSMREWYREIYLHSAHWLELRKAAKEKYGEKCNRCPKSGSDVHHRQYRYIYDVTVGDLEVICRACHDLEHGGAPTSPKRPRDTRKPVEKLPQCPRGVSRSEWHAWIMCGQNGDPPQARERKTVQKVWARPKGVPRKEWADWMARGMVGPRPQAPAMQPKKKKAPPHRKTQKRLFFAVASPAAIDIRKEADRHQRGKAVKWA